MTPLAWAAPVGKQPVPISAYQPLESPAPFTLQRSIYEKRKADSEQVRIDMGLKRLPVWEMSYAVWRPELAERFKLPPSPEGEQLPSQILGIEFYVESTHIGMYTCNLQVFAEEQLPFAYPFDLPTASDGVLAIGNRFFARNRSDPGTPSNEGYLRLNQADRDLDNRSFSVFLRSVYTASADFVPDKRGFQTSHTLTEFNRRLLPGIAYLNIRLLSCNYLMRGLDYPAATELWLERAEGRDYVRQLPVDKQDFIRVPLPPRLLEITAPWIKQIEVYNDAFRKELRRRKIYND